MQRPQEQQSAAHSFHCAEPVAVKAKLRIAQYDHAAPLQEGGLSPRRIVLLLKQGAGSANQALVKPGDQVGAGQALGAIPEKALGAVIHAPFAASVAEVTPHQIVLIRL